MLDFLIDGTNAKRSYVTHYHGCNLNYSDAHK